MVTKGKITVEDGKVLSEELKRDMEEKKLHKQLVK